MSKRTLIATLVGLTSATVIAAPGDVRLSPATLRIVPGQPFSLQILVDSETQRLGGYTLELSYDRNLVQFETTVANGANSLSTANVYNVENDKGSVKMTGLDVDGKNPGGNLHILTLNGAAPIDAAAGTATLKLTVVDLINEMADTIGTPNGQGATIAVTTVPILK